MGNKEVKQTQGRHDQLGGFTPRQRTTDAAFALSFLLEKSQGQRELRCVLVDLEKTFDKLPRQQLRSHVRKSGTAIGGQKTRWTITVKATLTVMSVTV